MTKEVVCYPFWGPEMLAVCLAFWAKVGMKVVAQGWEGRFYIVHVR